ncbi:Glutamine cyclotransferase [Seminavis robusta]|uniref:Glutamine cyclotransferase n=1 Tax=Seminavis robusta TaxID=568900 RepID=A0A9N8HLR7_9STRA|nr:Glutamine cyclotransferase [Seminavis robusta]|eukprot:Sro834_g208640.1 Glutamine cyclotransferase (465) ;mRNA; f:8772-10348
MDNDVELTTSRKRRDTDEVYPLDELQKNPEDDIYQPATRRQNHCFVIAIVFGLLAVASGFGAKVYLMPAEDVALETEGLAEDGTVINNADNAKMSEAMRNNPNNTPGKKKPHSSAQWTEPKAPLEKDGEDAENSDKDKPDENKDKPDENNQPPEHEKENEDPAKKEESKPKENEVETPADTETNDPAETTIDEQPAEQKPDKNKKKKLNFEKWHNIKVTKDDGVMYEVQDVLKHGARSFTEGLTFYDGKLYESVGLQGASFVLQLDPDTGETIKSVRMSGKLFAEGLTYCHGKLYQLTYKAKQGFIYDINDLDKKPETFTYDTTTGEGWGFTYDEKNDEFIVSDGSAYLHFWDRKTLKQKRKHQIMRLSGHPAVRINELEWWRDRVVANVWYRNVLLIINPVTGLVEKEYDFNDIWNQAGATKNDKAEVFNGISISDDPDVLYVTGKWWGNMFKVKLLPEVPEE